MSYLKKQYSVILFFMTLVAVLLLIHTNQLRQVEVALEEFEPVVIEQIIQEEPEQIVVEPIEEVQPTINCAMWEETQRMVMAKSEEYNIDFAFTMAVIFKESSFNPMADSGSSVGLMQINRINHEWLSEELGITNFWDPEQNVTAGLHILNILFEKYEDPRMVLMAYNMGESGAKKKWNQGVYTSKYADAVMEQAKIYKDELEGVNEDGLDG